MKKLLSLFAASMIATFSANAETITVNDDWIKEGEIKTMTADNVYVLDRFVFVEEGAELHIEPGTVIQGKPGQESNASALIIARGGKIFAEGTPTNPIIFTFEGDDPHSTEDFPLEETGKWGGLILLGNATTNNPPAVGMEFGEKNIEGIPENNPKGKYGGTDDNDNSGVIRYVSIRHGGTDIGDGNEINGLTMGAVGAGTTIEFVEVLYNKDDGFEFFGGTVNTKNLVSAFNGDDSFDYDEGFRGKGQFWFSIQAEGRGNMAGEHDGGNKPDDSTPYAIPTISNATYIGSGVNSSNSKSKVLHLRDNAGGKYHNSIFTQFPGKGLDIENLAEGEDSESRLTSRDLQISNNIWFEIAGKATPTIDEIAPDVPETEKDGKIIPGYSLQSTRDYFTSNYNFIEDPMLNGVTRTNGGMLNPTPQSGSPALTRSVKNLNDEFFTNVNYLGAFGQGDLWINGWTGLFSFGVTTQLGKNSIVVTDDWIKEGEIKTMTADNVYILDRFVFVEEGAELHIEPGTVIQGKPGQESNASALIIARGGKIFAEGTPTQPIIFTFEGDDPYTMDDFPMEESGKWGGLILLGNAPTNIPPVDGESFGVKNIEGIPENNPKGKYGGNVYDDNSGVLKFISVRHGGTDIGDGNEINGVTFGAVGAGTVVENIEVIYNKDDGFEFFGGTVSTKNLISAFNGDDSFDYDEGFNGKGQFWFSIQAENRGNMSGEHDGGNKPDDAVPFAIPTISNVTYIGSGATSSNSKSKGIHLRDNAGGKYFNSIFTDMPGKGLDVEDLAEGEDSEARLNAGELKFESNLWFNISGTETPSVDEIAPDVPETEKDGKVIPGYSLQSTRNYLSDVSTNNNVVNPNITSIDRGQNGILDPRPTSGPAWQNEKKDLSNDSFFQTTQYIGAFGDANWISNWTALSSFNVVSSKGYRNNLQEYTTDVRDANELNGIKDNMIMSYPNPIKSETTVEFFVPKNSLVNIQVVDVLGNKIEELVNKEMFKGNYGIVWTPENINSGAYMIVMTIGNEKYAYKVIVD